RTDRPDYDYSDGVTLRVYQLEDGENVKVEIPSLKWKIETTFDIRREGKAIHIQREGTSKTWNVALVGIDSVESVENAEIETINGSTFVRVNGEIDEIVIRLYKN